MTLEQRQRLRYVTTDFLATSLAWLLFNVFRYHQIEAIGGFSTFRSYYEVRPVYMGQIFFPLMMMALYALSGYYNRPLFRSRVDDFLVTASTAIIGSVAIYLMALFNDPIPDRLSNFMLLLLLFLLLFGVVYAGRLIITLLGRRIVNRGDVSQRFAIIGVNAESRELRRRLERYRSRGNRVVAYIDAEAPDEEHKLFKRYDSLPVYPIDNLAAAVERQNIQGIILTEESGAMENLSETLNKLYPLDIPIFLSPKSLQLVSRMNRVGDIAGEPLVDIFSAHIPEYTRNLKRTGDVMVSAIALLALSPLMLILAAWIRLDSKGPVFYRQERIGFHKKPFRIIKFRTMIPEAEAEGPRLSAEGDERVTKCGRFLRKYRLDELPQFWNVLCGEMSLVGPRPEREYFISKILQKAPYYSLLHQVRPGLTSWGMVKHGYASTVDEMIERSRFDLIYLENISLMTDMKILLHTVNTVLTGRGV